MADKTNILLIYSDQHRYDSVGCHDHPLVQTPNMDRLAAEGCDFTHAFTPIPICVPARCCMLTGQWAPQHGTTYNYDGPTFKPLEPDQPTSVRQVARAGYHTWHIGRWHVDPTRTPHDYGAHDYVPNWRYSKWLAKQEFEPEKVEGFLSGATRNLTPEQTYLGWSADRVIRALKDSSQETDPFFIRWQMAEPHLTCYPCEPFASMYDPGEIEPWPGWGDEFAGKPPIQQQMLRTWEVEDKTWEDWAQVVAAYFGVISQLDSQVGRVLDALDGLGLAENTLVIYSTDHGDMCGSHGMADKHFVMYDDVVRVPLTLRWPGTIPAGRTCDEFVANAIDLPITFCEVAGAEVPDTFEGVGLVEPACGNAGTGREDIFSTYHGNQFGGYDQRMVRDRRWKYVWNMTDLDELYDLETDPGELTNRVRDPACADELQRLRGRLVAWMEDIGDPMCNKWTRRMMEPGNQVW